MSSPNALVVGEALIDEVVTADRTDRFPGGSPANVALGLARLDVETVLHTAIGDDDDGRLIELHLARSGVALTDQSITQAPTSTATATIGVDGAADYDFSLQWDPSDPEMSGPPSVLHWGSVSAFLPPGCSITLDIAAGARSEGSIVSFDPNIRPALIGDEARARRLFEAAVAISHLVKLSDEDADYLYPGEHLESVLRRISALGPAVVAITRGGDGTILLSDESLVAVPAPVVAVADTVGAGDSFMAALIWALMFDDDEPWDGRTLDDARLTAVARIATQAAAITVARPGANPPTHEELRGPHASITRP